VSRRDKASTTAFVAPQLILHGEVEPLHFADPVVLRDGGQALIQEKFQAIVVSTHQKPAAPEVRPPVPNRLEKPNQIPLIGGEGSVARRNRVAEEGHGLLVLQEHSAEPVGGRVAHDGELLREVERRSTSADVMAILRASKAAVASSV